MGQCPSDIRFARPVAYHAGYVHVQCEGKLTEKIWICGAQVQIKSLRKHTLMLVSSESKVINNPQLLFSRCMDPPPEDVVEVSSHPLLVSTTKHASTVSERTCFRSRALGGDCVLRIVAIARYGCH